MLCGYCIGGPKHGSYVKSEHDYIILFPRLAKPLDFMDLIDRMVSGGSLKPDEWIDDLYRYVETNDGQGWWLHV